MEATMGLDLWSWSGGGLVLAAWAGGLMTTALGAGGGVLLLAVMGTLLPPLAVVPLHGVVMASTNTSRTLLLWRYIDLKLLLAVTAGTLVGVTLTGPLVVMLDERWASYVLGAGLLYLVWWPKTKAKTAGAEGKRRPHGLIVLLGAVTGALTLLVGAAGVLFAALLHRAGMPKVPLLATQSATMLVQHSLKVGYFALAGFAFAPWWPLLLAMMMGGWLGTWLGTKWLLEVNQKVFNWVFRFTITVLSLRLLWIAVT